MKRTELEQRLGVEIENHPYCIGYWMRVGGLRRPRANEERAEGWDVADRELAAARSTEAL